VAGPGLHEGCVDDSEQLMANLRAALTLANGLQMGTLAFLIERAVDEAQAAQFAALLPQKPPANESL
jgi:hypothetical protein